MSDVTLLCMAEDSPVQENPYRWRRGEIVNVYPKISELCSNPRFVFLHVTGAPASIRRLSLVLSQPHEEGDEEDRESYARRRFVMRLSVSQWEAILINREHTVTWEVAKSLIYKRVDRTLEFSRALEDFDIG